MSGPPLRRSLAERSWSSPSFSARETKIVAAPLEFERVRLSGHGDARAIATDAFVEVYTSRVTVLYRGDRLRFEPTSRFVIVRALGVDGGSTFENRLVGPTSALVLASDTGDKTIFELPTLEIGQRYKMVVASAADHDIDLLAWFEGRSILPLC